MFAADETELIVNCVEDIDTHSASILLPDHASLASSSETPTALEVPAAEHPHLLMPQQGGFYAFDAAAQTSSRNAFGNFNALSDDWLPPFAPVYNRPPFTSVPYGVDDVTVPTPASLSCGLYNMENPPSLSTPMGHRGGNGTTVLAPESLSSGLYDMENSPIHPMSMLQRGVEDVSVPPPEYRSSSLYEMENSPVLSMSMEQHGVEDTNVPAPEFLSPGLYDMENSSILPMSMPQHGVEDAAVSSSSFYSPELYTTQNSPIGPTLQHGVDDASYPTATSLSPGPFEVQYAVNNGYLTSPPSTIPAYGVQYASSSYGYATASASVGSQFELSQPNAFAAQAMAMAMNGGVYPQSQPQANYTRTVVNAYPSQGLQSYYTPTYEDASTSGECRLPAHYASMFPNRHIGPTRRQMQRRHDHKSAL